MSKRDLQMLAVSALRLRPDFSGLQRLSACSKRETDSFLTWLDQSGLALYFLAQLRNHDELDRLPEDLRNALERRLDSNRKRMDGMFAEFSKVNSALNDRRIPHAFLKGFTLVPEFCADASLRHQSDVDILVHPDSVPEAAQALIACGYTRKDRGEAAEIRFATPLQYVPSAQDDIYMLSPHREAELHTSIWEETGHVSLAVPQDCLERSRLRIFRGVEYVSLSLPDMFLMQAMHAFSHLLGSWVRVSWLWEIHYFLEANAEESELWQQIITRAGDDPTLRKALGLVLLLTKQLFESSIPVALEKWCVETLPNRVDTWVRHFGTQWALSELGGSKVTLFIHEEFVSDAAQWRGYFWHRLVPLRGRPSLGQIEASDVKTAMAGRVAQFWFAGRRLAFHTGEIFTFAREAFRWRHALETSRKRRAVSS